MLGEQEKFFRAKPENKSRLLVLSSKGDPDRVTYLHFAFAGGAFRRRVLHIAEQEKRF